MDNSLVEKYLKKEPLDRYLDSKNLTAPVVLQIYKEKLEKYEEDLADLSSIRKFIRYMFEHFDYLEEFEKDHDIERFFRKYPIENWEEGIFVELNSYLAKNDTLLELDIGGFHASPFAVLQKYYENRDLKGYVDYTKAIYHYHPLLPKIVSEYMHDENAADLIFKDYEPKHPFVYMVGSNLNNKDIKDLFKNAPHMVILQKGSRTMVCSRFEKIDNKQLAYVFKKLEGYIPVDL